MIEVTTEQSPFSKGDLVRPKGSAEPPARIVRITATGAHMVRRGRRPALPYGAGELEACERTNPGPWRNPCPVCGTRQPPCPPSCGFHPSDEDIELPTLPARRTRTMNDTTEPDNESCPVCGSRDWMLQFGGSKPPRIHCQGCKCSFTVSGKLVADPHARAKAGPGTTGGDHA